MSTAERFHHYRPWNPAACFAAASVPNMAAMTTTETMLQLPRIAARDICIRAADGYRLAGTLFEPKQASGSLTIVAPAVGISSGYYRKFASYLAERGRPSLVFDYRGMGASRHGPLEGFPARLRDWCILDVPSVLEWAARIYGGPLAWVGHSMGGFATGLAHNNDLIYRQLNIATLSGYWGHMARPECYRVWLLMGYVAPVLGRIVGYLPGSLIGGEDLPGPAFLEWARWCMMPGFFFDDPTLGETANFAHFRAPVRFAQIEDDPWGTPAAVGDMASHFTASVDRSIWAVRLADTGSARIGHAGFFRSEFRDTLWQRAANWLDGAPVAS
jgi:predicted alpha/beta hydrolase